MSDEKIVLVPYPKKVVFAIGFLTVRKDKGYISIPVEDKGDLLTAGKRIQNIFKDSLRIDLQIELGKRGVMEPVVTFRKDDTLKAEMYTLKIDTTGIIIGYGNAEGAFYAVNTLKQLIHQCGNTLPCLQIKDWADFMARGIMLDISRNKIPSMDTLYKIIDFMADLKLNQLQLYVEGFSFAYSSYPEVWKHGTPVTGEDIMDLDRYCRERYIELIPNQNSFGHMGAWLSREEFKDVAECPDGHQAPWAWIEYGATFDPRDPRVIVMLEKMYDDFLPYFSSDIFNVGCDETFELGQGKSRKLCEEIGAGRVYLNFLQKINELVKNRKKKMMFWGDIIVQHPELIPELPKDIIALEWGYSPEQPSREDCEKFKKAKIPFYVCPGTSCWHSITGRTDDMRNNLLTAAANGKECGAVGYLNTDWGDDGHWQYLPVSYAGFSYGAALSWGVEQNKDMDIAEYLNMFVFQDRNNIMGKLVLELGNYYQKERKTIDNSTHISHILLSKLEDRNPVDGICKDDFSELLDYINELSEQLDRTDMVCDDAELIYDEYRNAIRFIKHGIKLAVLKMSNWDNAETKLLLKEMLDEITALIINHKELWLKRNKSGGLEDSLRNLEKLKHQYAAIYKNN